MAESIIKDLKGKMDWVYVGKSEAPKAVEKKTDTIWNEYMRTVYDLAAPVAIAEVDGAAAVQARIAKETAQLMVPKTLSDIADKKTFAAQWLEWERKYSSPQNQNRLGKLLTGAVYMAGSFALDRGSDMIANSLILKKDAVLAKSRRLSLATDRGNKKMVEVGWDFLTDTGIEKFADWSVKRIANREDVGFVSPLSRTLGKLGSTILNVFDLIYDERNQKVPIINSFINPGFIEGAFRFTGSVPGFGFIKDFYAWANRQIMKGEGLIPFGTDLAYNMLIAKMINKPQKPL